MKLYVICVAYHRAIPMRILVDSFLLQTNPNWVLYVVHDHVMPRNVRDIADWYCDDRVTFIETKKRLGCYGHPNRKIMLETLPVCDDYVLMTNDDNYYPPVFVEYMLDQCTQTTGMVYCDVLHSHFAYDYHISTPRENHIDMGSFIVRLDVAKTVGFHDVTFSADGKYAEACKDYCDKNDLNVVHIQKSLFVHN